MTIRTRFNAACLLLLVISVTLLAHSSTGNLSPQSPQLAQNATDAVLVESAHGFTQGDLSALESFGTVTTVAGTVAVVHSTRAALQMPEMPFIERVETPHLFTVLLDRSVPDVGANTVWREVKDPAGRNVTGSGVVIGFVDTGIDFTNPDFYYPNGTTKVLAIWDQGTQGSPPDGFGYGHECTESDIQAGVCPEVDSFGHGTHVAGIAASSGMADARFTGVAPGSSIVFVKSGFALCGGTSWGMTASGILDGINYIIRKATERGMRAVINLSLGGNTGGHDGTDPLEIALDAIVAAGTPIVVAAGNDQADAIHVQGAVTGNSTIGIVGESETTEITVDIWYPLQDGMHATLVAPDGSKYRTSSSRAGVASRYGTVLAYTSSTSLARELFLDVNSTSFLPSSGWSVSLAANSTGAPGDRWDAWVDTTSCSYPGALFLPGSGYKIDYNETVAVPATADNVIAVGAYVTKTLGAASDYEVGGLAPFSAFGPSRDGRVKPDVVAPGMAIVSDRSKNAGPGSFPSDPFHTILAGTSMSTPHVAGVVALMLQYDPTIPPLSISGLLRETARWDSHTGVLPNGSHEWGFGKVDARTATGLFRTTLVLNQLPKDLPVTIVTDGKPEPLNATSSWAWVYFPKNTTHTIRFNAWSGQATDERFQLTSENFTVSSSALEELNYTEQYRLTVRTNAGEVLVSEWHDSGSVFTVDLPQSIPARGIGWFLGATYTLTGLTEDGAPTSTTVTMAAPKNMVANYSTTYSAMSPLLLTILASVCVLIIYLARRMKSSRRDRTGV